MSLNIVFMGTPDFAVPCLRRLIDDGYNVSGVFSQPDRPKGRGYQLAPPPVKALALEQDIPVFQPEKLRDGAALKILRDLQPDLAVVVAYGRILPPELLAAPRLGCINVHASLLPELRGAAPIQWAVIRGLEKTGVTIMHMAEGLDTGDIIRTKETPVGAEETAGELFERLSALGAECLSETLPLLEAGTAPRTPQDDALASWAPPIGKAMARLDFSGKAREICNLVRGLNPSPMARAMLDGKLIRIHKARVAEGSGEPGCVIDPARLVVACGDGAVELAAVQLEGKKPMPGTEFARGKRLQGGERFQ